MHSEWKFCIIIAVNNARVCAFVVVGYRDLNSKVLKLKLKPTVFLNSPDEIVPNVSKRLDTQPAIVL